MMGFMDNVMVFGKVTMFKIMHLIARYPRSIQLAGFAVLFLFALFISLFNVFGSGALWPDSPRYSNAAAMVRDWLTYPEWCNPIKFAKLNYVQYPGHSVPYHLPGYPAVLALVFLATGPSYVVARWFVAGCLGGSVCYLGAIQHRLGVRSTAMFATALLFLTTPEICRWSRDTMAELPALIFILAASHCFLLWLESGRGLHVSLAFGLAAMALTSRLSTVGVMPCWYLFTIWQGQWRRLKSPLLITFTLLYLALAVACVWVISGYAKYELTADGKMQRLSLQSLSYFACYLPTLSWGIPTLGLVSLLLVPRWTVKTAAGRFWLCWLASYFVYKLAMPTSLEVRHFLGAFPAFAGLAAGLLDPQSPKWIAHRAGPILIVLGLGLNLYHVAALPDGLVGYEPVAKCLAEQTGKGNVLLVSPAFQDLIFRYRCLASGSERLMIRGDRTLVIRLPDYARVDPQTLASDVEDVLSIVRRGRIRYLVIAEPDPNFPYPGRMGYEVPYEADLARRTVAAHPESFDLIARFPLRIDFDPRGPRCQVGVWAYREALPDGPSELPVHIPTANMELVSPK